MEDPETRSTETATGTPASPRPLNEKLPVEESPKQNDLLEEIPDGGRGWLVVLGVFLLNFGTWGANSGFAVYLNYDLEHKVFEGATKLDYAWIGGMAFGLFMVFCPFINYLQGLIGTHWILIVGNICQFLGVLLASFTKEIWQLYLTQGLLNSIGLSFISLPALTILPQWFKKKRTFAGGLATAGSGIGGILFNLGMQRIVQTRSVWWALRTQSIICLGVVFMGIALIRTRIEKKVEFTVFDKAVAASAGFYMLLGFLVGVMFGYVVVLYTVVNYTVSLGFTAHEGSVIAAMIQVGSFFGRPLVGFFADKVGPINLSLGVYTLCGILCLAMWIPARNYVTLVFFGLIMGGTMGSVYGTLPVFITKLVGLQKLNVAFSMLWPFLGLSGMVSPVIGVQLITDDDGPTRYLHTSLFAGLSFLGSALCLLFLRGYLIARGNLAGTNTNTDLGHLHHIVPPYKPFLHCLDLVKA